MRGLLAVAILCLSVLPSASADEGRAEAPPPYVFPCLAPSHGWTPTHEEYGVELLLTTDPYCDGGSTVLVPEREVLCSIPNDLPTCLALNFAFDALVLANGFADALA